MISLLFTLLISPAVANDRPNIVVITADTLRGDMLGVNGNAFVTTPHLDALAREGVNFRRAYTTITTTLPAHASLFTSLYPRDHKAYDNGSAISDAVNTLPEVLREHGYDTAAHINMPWLKPDVSNVPQGITQIRPGSRIRKADSTNEWVTEWIGDRADDPDPFFLWVHYVDNHTPYHAPKEWETRYFPTGKRGAGQTALKDIWDRFPADHVESESYISWLEGVRSADYVVGTYEGSVSWLDERVGEVIGALDDVGEWDDTIFVFTSDHGESLGEHDLWFVHAGLYESTAHIPLILRAPGAPEGVNFDGIVSLVDVMPSVLRLADLEVPEQARGTDLLPLTIGPLVADGGAAYLEHTGKQLTGVVTSRYKLIEHLRTIGYYKGYPMRKGRIELYDLALDPNETDDIAEANPDLVAELQEVLTRMKAGERNFEALTGNVDDDVKRALEALGYME